jgi:hypothetical protein
MANTLAEVAKTLNIRESIVQNPIKKIFLCGGQRIQKVGEPPVSLRGQLIALLEDPDRILPSYIVLAEEAVAWYHSLSSNRFSNLVELEACIAALSTQILLIVESAGSMTELGAFSFDNRLSKKLYAVLDKSYEKDQSFIMDGPIAKIRDLGGYCGRDWLLKPKEPEIDSVKAKAVSQRIITEILNPEIKRSPKKQTFDDQSVGHKMLLISDLVCLGGALREPEIFSFVKALNVELTRFELGQYLFLLGKMKFLSETHEGMDDYFFQVDPNLKFVTYATSDGRQFDRDRYRSYIQEALPKKGHYEDRKNVLKAAKQKVKA